MIVLIVGLVLFLGMHSAAIVAPTGTERLRARIGEPAWKVIYSLVSILGLVLIVWGYGLARHDPVGLWAPPVWTRHLSMLLLVPIFPLLLAAYLPGRIRATVKHPMLAAVKLWALAHLIANGNLADVVLFGSFLAWAVVDRMSYRYRPAPAVLSAPAGKANDLIAVVAGLLLYVAFVGGLHRWLFGVSPLGLG